MRRPIASHSQSNSVIWDILTFERLLTGQVVHLIYWAGLGIVVLVGFSALGAGVGLAIRGFAQRDWSSVLIGVPVIVGGLLAVVAIGLIWRGVCEFYVAVFRIADDLRALRRQEEARGG
ncbi:MAG TPA: DUF4282 domain-containing protein [Caulobacteraceae bacterium]|jgi:hypothetical protein|nr:DUF4282 domain-containing protein [Caulobacteraceae bacterium]